MKVYDVRGIRRQAVVFADAPDQAVSPALTSGQVGDWSAPEAREIPLPPGYLLSPARELINPEWPQGEDR